MSVNPLSIQRWLIEHIGLFEPGDIARIGDLGLVLQAYSNKWIYQDGELLRAQLGEDGANRVLPMRDLIDAGVHVSLATDNVPPTLFDPIWHVVSRRTEGTGRPLGPDQAISRSEALACASREGAWLSFEEDFKGTIERGKAADLCILNEDLLSVEEAQIASIESDLTMTGGRVVHQR